MKCTTSWMCAIAILLAASVQSQAQRNTAANDKRNVTAFPKDEIVAEEVVVESSLSIKPQQPQYKPRRVRDVTYYLIPRQSLVSSRNKRQFGGRPGGPGFGGPGFGQNNFQQPNYDSSQSTAQSDSHSQGCGLYGCGNANALAGAQAFQTSGPGASFGATASNAHTDAQNFSPFGGFSGSNSNSGGQTYNLPNGQTLNIAYNNAFSNANRNPAQSQGSSVSFSG